MSVRIFQASELDPATVVPAGTVVQGQGAIRLRRQDASGEYSREGSFLPGRFDFPNFYAEGMGPLTNFAVSHFTELPDGTPLGTLDYQLSNDGGVTFYYWDGGVWAVAGINDYSSEVDIDENVRTFPLPSPAQVQLRVRILPDGTGTLPGSGERTPLLLDAALAYDCRASELADMVESLQAYLESSMVVPFVQRAELEVASSQVTIDVYQNFSGVVGDPQVFNVTADPAKSVDLFASLVEDRGQELGTVTLSGAQSAGDIIEVQFSMRPYVFIGMPDFLASSTQDADDVADREAYPVAQLPSIALIPSRIVPDDAHNFLDGPAVRSRLRSSPEERSFRNYRLFRATCTLKLLSPLGADAWRMASSGKDVGELDNSFRSLATGELYDVLDFAVQERSQPAQNLVVLDYVLTVRGRSTDPVGTSTPLATTINIQGGSFEREWDDPVQVT